MSTGAGATGSISTLRGITIFEGFSDTELGRVAELGEPVEAEAGALLTDQGDTGTECFVVLEGTALVYVRGEHVATLDSGAMVGEMALVDHRPRTATVVAETPMRLLRFDTRHFRTLLDEMPLARERVVQLLTNRMRLNEG